MITQQLYDLESAVRDELLRAMRKHPTWPTDPLHALGVLNEEIGELQKAVLQLVYEPHPQPVDKADVQAEALQCAAMCLRFLLSLHRYDFTPSAQHRQE